MKRSSLFMLFFAAVLACAPVSAQDLSELPGMAPEREKAADTEAAEISAPPAGEPVPKADKSGASRQSPVIPVNDTSGGTQDAEWAFLKTAAASEDKDVWELVLPQLGDWLVRNPEHLSAPDAQVLKAELQEKLREYEFSLISLLKHINLYPDSASSEEAKKRFADLLGSKGDKDTRPALMKLSAAPETSSDDYNLSALLRELSAQAGHGYYEPLLAEYRYFFNRFPAYPGNDELRLALADLHTAEKKELAGRLEYEKITRMHPSTPLMARVKLSLARTLDENLREEMKAIAVYKDVAASFPGTDQAWAAYQRLPVLAEEEKEYKLAVEMYEKIIELYPEREEAYDAYREEARVLRDKLDDYPEAIAVFNRIADNYNGEKSVEALMDAVEVCHKKLKDQDCEVRNYDRLVADNPQAPEAAEALYEAGDIFYKEKNADKAREYFEKVLELYPDSSYYKKAQKRTEAIVSGKI